MTSENFSSNDLSLSSKRNNEPKLGKFCVTSRGTVVGGIGAWLVVVVVEIVDEVIIGVIIGRSAMEVGVCTSIRDFVSKINSMPTS
nr:hypothetical protein [Tanacetum cinerariifolium]